METNQIICGDALAVLKTLPADSVSCCISSPPYWALRDYGVDGQLGLEPTFEEYIDKLCTIYDEVRRVLRKDGTCFVNLGDTYNSNSGGYSDKWDYGEQAVGARKHRIKVEKEQKTLPAKSLCLIPQRFAIEMVNRGWILRNTIIWHKPNPMPSSAKDRFTVDFEYVYFFVKSKKYYFEPQYEAYMNPLDRWGGDSKKISDNLKGEDNPYDSAHRERDMRPNPLGRNKRCVWTISTQPFPEAHFATYPEKLVEPMIEAGCPKFICTKCGTPRKKMYEKPKPPFKDSRAFGIHEKVDEKKISGGDLQAWLNNNPPTFKGYSDCGCGEGWKPGIVMDCFAGAGTTLYVAAKLKRDYLGIELSMDYIKNIAEPRIKEAETGVPVKEARAGQGALFE